MTGRPPLLVIVGPTAAGKSQLALERAARLGGEIVNADSVQVYRGLDVGSAKPTAAARAAVRHHLLDLWPPTRQANAGAWLAEAEAAIADVCGRGRLPIVCGGTGLYVRALLEGLASIPEVPAELAATLRERIAVEGAAALHAELARVDPAAAARLAPNDGQRVGRALGVVLATGTPISEFQHRHRAAGSPRWAATLVGVFPERALLEARIDARARAMIAGGLIDEVRGLLAAGVPADAPGLATLGYREVVAWLAAGETTPVEALTTALAAAHRRYAKRQLTWWRDARFDERVVTTAPEPLRSS